MEQFIEPDILMAISLYKEKSNALRNRIHALTKEFGDYKIDAKTSRKIMDKYVPRTERLSKEIERMREE